MGCDGGTIPTRDELVKLKKKPERKDKDSARLYRWRHCAITQEPLRKPVVACEMGRLYNKESVIELLLEKKERSARNEHIEKLKDVMEIQLADNPAYDAEKASVGDGFYVDRLVSPWICPVTGLEMNGTFKFVFPWKIGRVVSERAVKILQKDEAEAGSFKEEDIIMLNPDSDELDLMNSKMIARRARVKAEKKALKDSKKKRNYEDNGGFKKPALVASINESDAGSSSSNDSNNLSDKAGTSSEEPKVKKAKMNNVSTFNDQKGKSKKPSLQEDGSKSEVYKSLFSSHKDAINKPVGNWVTFDPRYN